MKSKRLLFGVVIRKRISNFYHLKKMKARKKEKLCRKQKKNPQKSSKESFLLKI